MQNLILKPIQRNIDNTASLDLQDALPATDTLKIQHQIEVATSTDSSETTVVLWAHSSPYIPWYKSPALKT